MWKEPRIYDGVLDRWVTYDAMFTRIDDTKDSFRPIFECKNSVPFMDHVLHPKMITLKRVPQANHRVTAPHILHNIIIKVYDSRKPNVNMVMSEKTL